MSQITSRDARLVYENGKHAIMSIKDPQTGLPMYSLEHAKLTQSFIRSEATLSTSLASYKFPIKINDQGANSSVNNKLLQLQDLFVVSSIGLFLANATTPAQETLETWNDPKIFTTGAASLQSVYNGLLALSINNNIIVPGWDTIRHKLVPITQTGTNVGYTASGVNLADSFNGSVDGFYPCEPNWLISGGANVDFTLQLPAAPSTLDANTNVILVLRGILAQNVTTVK